MSLFDRWRRPARAGAQPPTLPPGVRAYAIGDVHGRLDLLTDLLARIEEDHRARGPAKTHLVMLGDLIDRGPESAGVLALLRNNPPAFARLHIVMGNHEEMLLTLADAPAAEPLAHFMRYGGYQTLESFGAPERMLELPEFYPPEALLQHVAAADLAFMRTFVDHVRLGDYLFVHAGIRPAVPLEGQVPADLRWIRAPFLESTLDHGVVVVHGHTISRTAEFRGNRIGIDTGAFASGVLTALGLEGSAHWLLQTPAAERRSR